MALYVEDVRRTWEFDSSIDPPYFSEDRIHYDFTIILRIYLKQLNPPPGKNTFRAPDFDGMMWPALRWTRAAWLDFTSRYLKLVLKVWDKAFVLIPPAGYHGFVFPQGGRRRNLMCRLRLKLQDEPDKPHAAVQVVRLATPTQNGFRSDSGQYDSGDVKLKRVRYAPEGASFLHNTPAHEVGHLLGLWDAGVGSQGCSANPHSSACYGSNLHERMNVMGGGGMLDLSNARPWLRRATVHVDSTRESDWKVDWASSEAALRGLEGFQIDEKFKKPYQPPKPGLIDL